jgi:hypothetical protein
MNDVICTAYLQHCGFRVNSRLLLLALSVYALFLWGDLTPRAEAASNLLRFGFTSSIFKNRNENDILAAMKVWAQTIANERGVGIDSDMKIYKSSQEAKKAVKEKRVDALILLLSEYATFPQGLLSGPYFRDETHGNTHTEFVLLSHRDGRIVSDIRSSFGGRPYNLFWFPAAQSIAFIARLGIGPRCSAFRDSSFPGPATTGDKGIRGESSRSSQCHGHNGTRRAVRYASRLAAWEGLADSPDCQVKAQRPDLIVLLGDIFEGHGPPGDHLVAAFKQLSAPLGIWAVSRNHEFHGRDKISLLEKSGFRLMLSGHTHGGQIWPFDYLVRNRYPLLEGRYEVEGMTVIVCRGTGTWGPRMRLWYPSEILRVTLRRKSNKGHD